MECPSSQHQPKHYLRKSMGHRYRHGMRRHLEHERKPIFGNHSWRTKLVSRWRLARTRKRSTISFSKIANGLECHRCSVVVDTANNKQIPKKVSDHLALSQLVSQSYIIVTVNGIQLQILTEVRPHPDTVTATLPGVSLVGKAIGWTCLSNTMSSVVYHKAMSCFNDFWFTYSGCGMIRPIL